MFVTNQKGESANRMYKSQIKGVGILDPGPIDNRHLFDSRGRLKQDLLEGQDFTFLEAPVWNFLWERYGGGPIVKRRCYDIYSEAISVLEEENIRSLKL